MGNKKNSCRRLSRRSINRSISKRYLQKVNIENTIEERQLAHEYILPETNVEPACGLQLSSLGRRIVDIGFIFEQICNNESHSPFSCSIVNMKVVKEQRKGNVSIFTLKCEMCNVTSTFSTEKGEGNNMNHSFALGAVSTGIGYSQMKEFQAVLNIPSMVHKTFNKHLDDVSDIISETAWGSMKEAANEEKRLALLNGDVDSFGIPFITVITDGAWSKRSYNINYNAASGIACIIGYRTKKVIYIGVRNKLCSTCDRATTVPPKQHKCFKNWNGTSTGMEADIILEGFRRSMEMYGIKYLKLVADGDSSVYRKITENKPYGIQMVEKVECTNHLLRNFCKKIRELCERRRSNSKSIPVPPYLRNVLRNNMKKIRIGINTAVKYRSQEDSNLPDKITNFQKDIQNIICHIFGDHTKCNEIICFICTKGGETNYITPMTECGLLSDIKNCTLRLSNNASSLLQKMDTNDAEHFNSIVCKFVGGKRVNFSLRRQYQTRCEAAVVSYNSNGMYYSALHKVLATTSSIGKHTQKYVEEKIKERSTHKNKNPRKRRKANIEPADEHYGPHATIDDMEPDEFNSKKEDFLKKLTFSDEIESLTRGQNSNPRWHEERSIRLTASRFGEIIKMKKNTSRGKKVEGILYSKFTGNAMTAYGQLNEEEAIIQFEKEYGVEVTKCGLFVCKQYPYLASSPDGLVGNNFIIEVKCPYKARYVTPKEAVINKLISYATIDDDGNIKLNKRHSYYYQIQGQLNIAERDLCYFIIYTPKCISVEKIERDIEFWENEMLQPLSDFYLGHMLPELVDPRKIRNLPIRN